MKINAYKIRYAQKFLNELKKALKPLPCKEALYLNAYSNGREQGYHLSCFNGNGPGRGFWGCSFSEHRSSDDLVVYIGLGITAFSMAGNVPDELTYSEKACYPPDQLDEAVNNVIASLRSFLKEAEHAKV